jgi:hypothetical protein
MPMLVRAPILLIIALIVVTGCEESVEPDVPYVPRLVIRGYLEPLSTGVGLRISRTLPLDQPIRTDASINDAVATITNEQGERFQLEHPLGTIYVNSSLVPRSGERYRLDVDWNGRHVSGETVVPFPPEIVFFRKDSITLLRSGDSILSVTVGFRPRGEACYNVEFWFGDSLGVRFPYKHINEREIVDIDDTTASGLLEIPLVRRHRLGDSLVVNVNAYDRQFAELVRSFYREMDDIGAFGSGYDHVQWNIDGDGVGFFIGRAVGSRGMR